jgi:hypothetical protein
MKYSETPPTAKACALHYCHKPPRAGIPRTLSACTAIRKDRVLVLEYPARRNVKLGVIRKPPGEPIKQGRLRNRKLSTFTPLFMKPLGAGSNTVPVIHKIILLKGRESCGSANSVIPRLPTYLFSPVPTGIKLTAEFTGNLYLCKRTYQSSDWISEEEKNFCVRSHDFLNHSVINSSMMLL